MVEQKKEDGWKTERTDKREIQFTFGVVRFRHTLMYDLEGEAHYPFDEWAGFKKSGRRSPYVDVKIAELASENTYREVSRILKEWTAVEVSHTTVANVVKKVGGAQGEADQEMVTELEESAELPEGEELDYLYVEADGVFVRGTKKKKSHEVRHAIVYEGWAKNGQRVALKNAKVIMTTQANQGFWDEVQASVIQGYSLEKTQVVTNSDGGAGYTAEKFQEAFSQSTYPVLNQLDAYHVYQALNRALGASQSQYKAELRKAIERHDLEAFKLWLDTYESSLENNKKIKKVKEFRTYILNNWERIRDWRKCVTSPPQDARSLGAMESHQRHVTYRMKKRGMHWSKEGAEAMVKIKQGRLNGTLREAYLKHLHLSARKQREVKRTVRMSALLHQSNQPSIGVREGSIPVHGAHSSPIGNLAKNFS